MLMLAFALLDTRVPGPRMYQTSFSRKLYNRNFLSPPSVRHPAISPLLATKKIPNYLVLKGPKLFLVPSPTEKLNIPNIFA